MPSFSTGISRPNGLRTGVITAIHQGIATVTLHNAAGTVTFHPSAWRSSYVDGPRVGDRVAVSGSMPVEAAWRE